MAARSGRTMRWRSPQRRKARPVSPVPQHAHFLGATTLDLCRTFTVNVHHAVPRCATRSTAALRNDGLEDVANLRPGRTPWAKRYRLRRGSSQALATVRRGGWCQSSATTMRRSCTLSQSSCRYGDRSKENAGARRGFLGVRGPARCCRLLVQRPIHADESRYRCDFSPVRRSRMDHVAGRSGLDRCSD
jgi:hypothetical protein